MTTLDIEHPDDLTRHLRDRSLICDIEVPRMSVLAGGVSNRTVLVERDNGESWVVKQALEKLRVAVDWYSSPDRIHREAFALRRLPSLAPPGTITPLVDEDVAAHIIVMEAVKQPHANWKTLLMQPGRGPTTPELAQFAAILASIHRRSRETIIAVAEEFDDRTFFTSLRLEPYYAYSYDRVPEASFLPDLIDATKRRRFALVHGDYSPKNILVKDGNLVLLDHEVIHFGDPAFDVGFALTHLLSKAHHLKSDRGLFITAAGQFWVRYKHELGPTSWDPDFEQFVVLHTLGCLLARTVGRSPLEYLSPIERDRQRAIVLTLAVRNLATVGDFIVEFRKELDALYAKN